ncbi:hypothetical protein ACFLZS_00100 [Patescibacteria group bacterium]
MPKEIPKITTLKQKIEEAETSLRAAKQIVEELSGDKKFTAQVDARLKELPKTQLGEKPKDVIEGVFDGESMIADDGKKYPVPANYASKSKLIEGDMLKLTISEIGAFIYKQIGPTSRKMLRGALVEENGEYHVVAEGKKIYKVILASVTYFRAKPGDEVTIVVPESGDSEWAAIENVIFQGGESEKEGK